VYEYVEMSKKTKIPDQDVKKKPIYDQDYKYPKYVIFCSKNSAEVDKKSKSPPNKTQQNNSSENSSNNLPIVQQQKFDESILNSQFLIENRRLSENSSEIISKFKNLIDYEQNYGHAYEDLYAAEHSYEYVESNRSTRFHVQKIDEPKSKLSDDESKIQLWAKNYAQHCRATCIGKNGKVLPRFYEKEHGGSSLYDVVGISDADEHVYEALDTSRPSRFKITKVDESALRKNNIYEPICVRPRWVDYLYIPPPHKRLPKKDCMGRVQWLNKPVRKKTSAGSISGRGLSTSGSRKMSDNNIDSSNTTSRKNSDNFDLHIYENTEIKTKPACEEVVSKDSLETRLDASKENDTDNIITEGHSEVLSKSKPLIEQETNKQTTDNLEANSNLENTDVEGMRTYEAVFL